MAQESEALRSLLLNYCTTTEKFAQLQAQYGACLKEHNLPDTREPSAEHMAACGHFLEAIRIGAERCSKKVLSVLIVDGDACKDEFKAFAEAVENPSSSWMGWGQSNTDSTLDTLAACHRAKVRTVEGAESIDFDGGESCLDAVSGGSVSDKERACVERISKFLARIGLHKNV